MKIKSLKGKHLLLGIQLALALGVTTLARSKGQSWVNSLLLGAGTYGIASTIGNRKKKQTDIFQPNDAIQNVEEADQILKDATESGQQLVDRIMKRSIELAQQPNVFAVISYNEDIDYEILGEFTTETDAKSFFEKAKKSPPSASKALEICIMNNGYFVMGEDDDEGVIERFEIPDDL